MSVVQQIPRPQIEVIGPNDTIGCHWLDGAMHIYDTGANSGYAMTWLRTFVKPGSGPNWHIHTREDELFYVRSGRFAFEVPLQPGRVELSEGELISLPVGVPHRFSNIGAEIGELISLNVPGGMPQFFIELSNRLDQPFKVPNEAEIAAAGERFGAIFVTGDAPETAILALSEGRTAVVQRRNTDMPSENVVSVSPMTQRIERGPRFEVSHVVLGADVELPVLRHARFTVGIFVLDGCLRLTGDGFDGHIAKDHLAILPFGVSYRIAGDGSSPATMLVASNPDGITRTWATLAQSALPTLLPS
jgi:mannose-6-phosphate isomerase-like protein (cupin superfamily)